MKRKQNYFNESNLTFTNIYPYIFHRKKRRYYYHNRFYLRSLLQYWSPTYFIYKNRQLSTYNHLREIVKIKYKLNIIGIFKPKLLKEYYIHIAATTLIHTYNDIRYQNPYQLNIIRYETISTCFNNIIVCNYLSLIILSTIINRFFYKH